MFAADPKLASGPVPDTPNAEPAYSWKNIIEPVEPFLEAVGHRLAKQVDSFDLDLLPYADYALNGQGKHLRPALVALIAHALKLAAGFPTPEVCRAVALATNTVCSGEIIQTQHRRDFQFTREKYFKVLEMKTAELFALSCDLSAFLSGASPEARLTLRHFGLAFGTAYQVYDDCVDLFGLEAVAGKSLGTDLAKGKLTLPVLLLWERADAPDRLRIQELVQA